MREELKGFFIKPLVPFAERRFIRMKIALINPLKFQEKLVKRNEVVSLLYLKQFLMKYGYNADVIDFELEDGIVDIDEVTKMISGYDIIGISCYYPFNPLRLASIIKEYVDDVYVFAGGPMASLEYKDLLFYESPIDAVVINEGEWSLLRLIRCYESKEQVFNIKGVATYRDGEIEFEQRMFEKDLDKFPYPRRPYGYYKNFIPTVISSRGCNGKCTFCSTRYTGFWRGRSATDVYEEIEHIVNEHGETHFQFVEPNFLHDGNRANNIADLIMELPCKVTFDFACRIDSILVCEQVIKQLKRAGAIKVLLGVENFSNKVLGNWRKEITCEDIGEAIKILRDNELAFSVSIILFFPEVSVQELIFNIEQIDRLEIINYVENLYNALILIPGTKMNLSTKKKQWEYKDNYIREIYERCIDYRTKIMIDMNDFCLINVDYIKLFMVNAFYKIMELNKLKELLNMPILKIQINEDDIFCLNRKVCFEGDKRCINMETGMITQLDDISLKVLNYISNKNFYWIIEDLKSVADTYSDSRNKIIEIICILLRNRIILIEG